jgi:hypothetical protein
MFGRLSTLLLVVQLCFAGLLSGHDAGAQSRSDMIVIRNGESVELHSVFYIANCRSIMVGLPEIDVVEGPPEVTLSIREGAVIPRNRNCAKPVPGGTLLATAKDVAAPKQVKLTYRLKYKTRDGDRQTARSYELSLFP